MSKLLIYNNLKFFFFFIYLSSFSQDKFQNSTLLDQIVLTAQYIPTHIDSSIYSIEIISQESLSNFGSQNLSNVLSRHTGIDVFHDPFLGNYIDFQGISGENIKVLIDGIEMSGLHNGSVDFSQISINNIERIEIIEGPLSNIYGNNALGATINLISKTNQNEKVFVSAESYFESIGQYNLNGNVGFELGGNTLSTSIGRHYFDGWSSDDSFLEFPNDYYADSTRFHYWKPKEQWFVKSNYSFKTKSQLTIKPYLDYLNERVVNKGLPQGAFLHYAFDDYYNTTRFDKGILIEGPFLNRIINVVFHHNRYNRIKNNYYVDLTDLTETLLDNVDTTIINLFTHRVTCSNVKRKKLNYQYGYAINYEKLNTPRVLNLEKKRVDFSGFSSLDYRFNNFIIRSSFRYLYSDENNNAFTPALNLKYNFHENVSLRFSYASGFRIPSLKEMYFNFVDINHNIQGNSSLKSETSNSYQINLNSKFSNTYILNFKLLYNKIDNFIMLVQNDNTTNFQYVNIGNYRILGSKIGLKFNNNDLDFHFNTAYLGQSSVYNSDINFYIKMDAMFKYHISSKHTFSVFFGFNGAKSVLSKNALGEITLQDISSYNMLDVSYALNLSQETKFSFGINNLFNVTNIDSETLISSFHNTEAGIPLSCGRHFYTSLKFNISYD